MTIPSFPFLVYTQTHKPVLGSSAKEVSQSDYCLYTVKLRGKRIADQLSFDHKDNPKQVKVVKQKCP